MKYAAASLAFGLGATAASLPRDSCSFTLTASGGQSGVVGQLGDGQNRVGGGLPTGHYTINNGKITDSAGRGCILTPPTTQLQCDVGATPTGGFSLGSNGQVESNGSPDFYACPATDSAYNIYTTPVNGQDKCVKIGLTASGCYAPATTSKAAPVTTEAPPKVVYSTVQASCPAPQTVTEVKTVQSSCPAAQTVTVTAQAPTVYVSQPAKTTVVPAPASSKPAAPAPAPSAKTCPANLSGQYQYPHLIVPVSKSNANKAYGTSYNGKITSDVSSIFNFDIPTSYTGTCSLVFLFPEQKDLETSSYTFSGDGKFDFAQLSTVASQKTTYASQGSVKQDLGVFTATPGSSNVIATYPCPAGQAVSVEISSASGSSLEYFQDYNPSPIGLYITTC